MSFDWSKYLDLAQELATPAKASEARQRSSISRAYYAAFIKARNHLRDKDKVRLPFGASVHDFVITSFENSSDRVRMQIGQNLRRMRFSRNKADYNDTVKGLTKLVRRDLLLANQIIHNLNRL